MLVKLHIKNLITFSLKRYKIIQLFMANTGASNENDSQIKQRRRLPPELHCEIVRTLLFHSSRRMLLVSNPIATNCVSLVRKQKQKFENRWDPMACHALTLTEPERLVAQNHGNHRDRRGYVFAERPIPKNGIFYYEVNIVNKSDRQNSSISIGLGKKPRQLDHFHPDGTMYGSSGLFWGHPDADSTGMIRVWNGAPSFDAGDVIGCGINLATRRIIYTKNGERLDTPNLFVPNSAADLFPFVMLREYAGNKRKAKPESARRHEIEANFGPNFKFDIVEVINQFYGISS